MFFLHDILLIIGLSAAVLYLCHRLQIPVIVGFLLTGLLTGPYGFRLVYNKTWHSRWYAQGKNYSDLLHQDLKLREDLKKRLGHARVAAIDIERAADRLRVTIHTSRPGIIIGRKGAEVDRLRDDLIKRTGREVHINIQEIQRPELDAQLVSESTTL